MIRTVLAILCCVPLVSCAQTQRHERTIVRDAVEVAPVEPQRRTLPKIEQISHDTWIYRCQNLRAEETAETLQRLVEQNTDVEYIIVPHEETNSLLIKRVPRDPNDPAGRRSGVRSPRTRR